MMQMIKKAGKGLVWSVILIIVAWSLFMTVSRLIHPTKYPMAFGYSEANIISGSMEPTLSVGDHVVFRRQDSYQVDDIIVYYNEENGIFVVHRIVGRSGDKWIVQGDYNSVSDADLVTQENIQGKVIFAIQNLQPFLYIGYGSLATVLIQWIVIQKNPKEIQKGGEQANEEQSTKDI